MLSRNICFTTKLYLYELGAKPLFSKLKKVYLVFLRHLIFNFT